MLPLCDKSLINGKERSKNDQRNAKKQKIRDAYKQETPVTVTPASTSISKVERKLRVAAYCRVSTDSETQSTSFELQRQEYEEKIMKEDDWEYAGIYADEGMTGTSAVKRKQFQQMIQDCRDRKIDLILVKNVSRFMRNQVDCLTYIRELSNLSPPVGVLFETDNIDTRRPGYELHLGFYSAFAQAESENKSQSIRWSNERRWSKGIMHCNTDQFYGYTKNDDGEMIIVPKEAQLVRSIYRKYHSGLNVRQIAEWLTKTAVPTFYGSKQWSQTSVRNILKNEVYCGDLVRPKRFTKDFLNRKVLRNKGQRDSYCYPDHHPAIIPRQQWNMVQEQLIFRRYARDRPRKPLQIHRMPGTLGAFYLLNPAWDAYDLARVRDKLFPPPPTEVCNSDDNEKRVTECKNLI